MSAIRPYQARLIGQFRDMERSGVHRILAVAPTASGKTVVAAEIIRRYVQAGQRVMVLAHRREIIAQTASRLTDCGLQLGVIRAGFADDPTAALQVASVQTLHARAIRSNRLALPPADLLVADECHHAPARTWRTIIDTYPGAVLLGLTATPCRGDGRGLGGIFEVMIECPQVQELIAGGYLVPTIVYAPTIPDLLGVRVQAGDYVESQLADRMDRPKLVGDIVTQWHRLAEGRRTVVFATGVQHSIHIRDEFRKSGVSCDHLDGSTPKGERDEILLKLRGGVIDVVSNCMVLTEGWDLPDLGCIVLARPTKKMGLYRQMVGRGLRPAPGKSDVIVIDHSGAVHRHGFVEDYVDWTLEPDKLAENPIHAVRCKTGAKSRLVDCSQCGALRVGGEACRHCGFKPTPPAKFIPTVDADLALTTRNGQAERFLVEAERNEWHGMLTSIASERGYRSGWIAHKFREKFGIWPRHNNAVPLSPSKEVRAWVRSRQIAYAKALEKSGARHHDRKI